MAINDREEKSTRVDNSFVGGIPPFLFFEMQYHSLFYLVQAHKDDPYYKKQNPAAEIATIGLVAHFEAFCKHHFAAIVNVHPVLLHAFCVKRGEPKIEISTLLSFDTKLENNFGFILSEQYDFGSGKMINGLFRDLLMVTPFSEDEAKSFDAILQKRNLLVHHAGFYTLQHLKEHILPEEIKEKAFRDAIRISTENFEEISDFFFEMAMKIVRTTVPALKKQLDKIAPLKAFHIEATEGLYRGVYDSLEE
jgi:hypothetical protein